MRTNSTTLKDIASIINVSVSTVSKALSNSHEISTHTKNKVLKVAALLKYKPNFYASALRNKKSLILGVILPDLKDKFFLDTLNGITEESSKNDYKIMVYQTCNNTDKEVAYTKLLSESNIIDGLIFSSIKEDRISKINDHLDELTVKGLPIVYVGKHRSFNVSSFAKSNGFNTGKECVREMLLKIDEPQINLSA